ncbi:MAG: efflux RND transporter permease subunit, partial [Cellvibrionales bacterium]|nr:efflux RND transporter permease subunit [Cellvibrionales bacterium]
MDMFVNRPVLAVVLSLVLVIAGVRAAGELSVSQFPRMNSASLIISTFYVGASAEVVQGFITDPIERVAATVPGVDYIDSSTTAGHSTVTAWLKLNEDSTAALAELSSRLDQIRFELPAGAEDPTVEVRRADRLFALFYLSVPTERFARAAVTDYLTRNVNPILATIDGVQRVGIEGRRSPAMRLWVDSTKMLSFDVSAEDLRNALAANNVITALGRSENDWQRISMLADTNLQTVRDFENLVVREVDGTLVRLRDIARVELGEEEGELNARLAQHIDGQRVNHNAVYISIWPLPGVNEIEVGDQLYRLLDEINPTLPEGMKIQIGFDGTLYMRNAIKEIFKTLAETVLLVGLVVLLLMGSVRTALVPLITIPISLLGATAAMAVMGFSLNLLTVLAIVLSVGLVVDDAIVVVENVARHMRAGKGRVEAALASSRQLLTPIIGMTITLAAVYAPIGFLSGLTGVIFKEFAFTLSIAVLISGVVALTLSPIMSAHACPEGGREGRATRWVNARFDQLRHAYGRLLEHIFAWQKQILCAGVFFSLLAAPLYLFSWKELAPVEDDGIISIVVEAPSDASLDYTSAEMHEVVDTMFELPYSDFMWQIMLPSGGFGGLGLLPLEERGETVHDLLLPAFDVASKISGLKVFPILSPPLPTAGNFDVELVVQADAPPAEMRHYAEQIIAAAQDSGQFMFVDTELRVDMPEAHFVLDRERIAELDMDLASVGRQLSVLLSANYVNRFDLDGKAYRVIPMLDGQERL